MTGKLAGTTVVQPVQEGPTTASTPLLHPPKVHAAPELGTAYRYLSFFKYIPIKEEYLEPLQRLLQAEWSRLGVLGRIYIGDEGQG